MNGQIDGKGHILPPIEVGQKIRIHLPGRKTWSVVRGWMHPHVIMVDAPVDQPAKPHQNLEIRGPCLVQYLREGVIHIFKTEILGVMKLFDLIQVMGLRFPKTIKSQNLRAFPRVKIHIPATIFEPEGRGIGGVILDISLGGCRAEASSATFRAGDNLRISFTLPNQPQADVPCEVRRCNGSGQYGLEFRGLSGPNKKAVNDFLEGYAIVQSTKGVAGLNGGMIGHIEEVSVPDLLQILANSRRSYQLNFTTDSDWAKVYVKDSEVVHARTSNLEGAAAIFELISWQEGTYRIQQAELFPLRNVSATLEHLLLEYVYRQDENSMGVEKTIASNGVMTLTEQVEVDSGSGVM